MDLGINGKVALVTASSRGLGRGCAEQLAGEQCRVAICSRDEVAAKEAAAEIAGRSGSEVVGFGADVSNSEDIGRLLKNVKQSLGDPEILVTNAGGPPPGTFARAYCLCPPTLRVLTNLTLLSICRENWLKS